jgi:predicted nucleotidyltransferase
MAGIPESQLETWAGQGAVVTAASTYHSIRKALRDVESSPVRYKDVDVYLQGSYRNDNNIRGDSDIDVVVELNSTFSRNLAKLSAYEAQLYRETYSNATYFWQDFRADVLEALRHYVGYASVGEGNKCLKVAAGSGRLAADVVVCQEHREYRHFYGVNDQSFVEGIKFWTRKEGREVVNFPKPHHDNGVGKNSALRTGGAYKPTVRMFKNARTHMSKKGLIATDLAPSYFLECLLYNVPDWVFSGSRSDAFFNVLRWLYSADFSGFYCQNGQTLLFGPTPEQWNATDARRLVGALTALWNGWS